MDLQKLEADLGELEQRFRERNGTYWRVSAETLRKVNHNGYTAEDRERELEALSLQSDAIYIPGETIRPLLNEVIAAYVIVTAEERATIRDIMGKPSCASYGLLDYILECAERIKTPEDEDVFRLALVAASIENYAHDFRDTNAVLAELAMAAVKAGINIEPHCTAIAKLYSADQSKDGWPSMKQQLAEFHIYAPKAVRLF